MQSRSTAPSLGLGAIGGSGIFKIRIRKEAVNMFIEKYWGNYIGGTDDSLTLLDYLIDKQKDEISLSEIFF